MLAYQRVYVLLVFYMLCQPINDCLFEERGTFILYTFCFAINGIYAYKTVVFKQVDALC